MNANIVFLDSILNGVAKYASDFGISNRLGLRSAHVAITSWKRGTKLDFTVEPAAFLVSTTCSQNKATALKLLQRQHIHSGSEFRWYESKRENTANKQFKPMSMVQ